MFYGIKFPWKKRKIFTGISGNIKNKRGEIKLKIEDTEEIKDFEEKIKKLVIKEVIDRAENLKLSLLLAILKALNKLIQKY